MKPTAARLSAHSDDGTPPYTYTLSGLSLAARRAIADKTDSAENGVQAVVVQVGSLEHRILQQALHFTHETGLDDDESVASFAAGAGVHTSQYRTAFYALKAFLGA